MELRSQIKGLGKGNCGRFEKRIQVLEDKLLTFELKEEETDFSLDDHLQRHEASLNLLDSLKEEDVFWSQSSRDMCKKTVTDAPNYSLGHQC